MAAGLPDCDRVIIEIIMGFLSIPAYLSVACVSTQWRDAWGQQPTVTSRRWAVQSRSCLDWARAGGLEIWDSPCLFAAAEGRLDVLQHAVALGYSREGMPICEWAAGGGYLEVVKWCRANGYPWGLSSIRAAEGGYLEVLKWCVANGCPVRLKRRPLQVIPKLFSPGGHYRSKQPYYEESFFDVLDAAARGGRLEIVKWCRNQGYVWSLRTSGMAAEAGHLDALKWLVAKRCPWDLQLMRRAAGAGNLEVLEWCKANGCPWHRLTVVAAAESGNLAAVRWCVANDRHCNNHAMALARAAGRGHLEIVQWMRANGCPWGQYVCYLAVYGGHLEVLKWCVANGCDWGLPGTGLKCPFNGSVSMMMWAAANGCPWMSIKHHFDIICGHATRGGNLEVLKWCAIYGPLRILNVLQQAASSGQVHILEWIRASGELSEWPSFISPCMCSIAARSGSLETVKWCRANNFPWGSYTSDEAMASGNLELLQWCMANGCPWGIRTPNFAAAQGSIEALAWCRAHGCPMDVSSISKYFGNEDPEVIEWVRYHLPRERRKHRRDLGR